MEFITNNMIELNPEHIPVAQVINIAIPIAKPVITVLTWEQKLINFLKKIDITLDRNFINKMTDFSFENKWTEVQPKKGSEVSYGNFILTYTYRHIKVQLEGKYTFILTYKQNPLPDITNTLPLSGTFNDDATMDWCEFKCDSCKNINHPLWFIKRLNSHFCTAWWHLMCI